MSISDKTGIVAKVFGRTDVGLVREHNEDNFLVADLTKGNRNIKPEVREHSIGEKGSLFVVCDGMGGAAAGEVASQIGVDTIYEIMQEGPTPGDDEGLARALDNAVSEAGQRIHTAARADRRQAGMGTTATAAALIGPRLVLGQVGDSRAYVLRGDRFIQVTKDQSLVQQLIDAKQLTEEEARNFERNNIILQALGTTEEVHVDITSVVLRHGDVLLMCSDGLSGLVRDNEIQDVLKETPEPMEVCRRLTEMARDAGGNDNITVIVVNFTGDELLMPTPEEIPSYAKFHYNSGTQTTVRTSSEKISKEPNSYEEKLNPAVETQSAKEEQPGKVVPLLLGVAMAIVISVGAYWFFQQNNHKAPQTVPMPALATEPAPEEIESPVENDNGSESKDSVVTQSDEKTEPISKDAIFELIPEKTKPSSSLRRKKKDEPEDVDKPEESDTLNEKDDSDEKLETVESPKKVSGSKPSDSDKEVTPPKEQPGDKIADGVDSNPY